MGLTLPQYEPDGSVSWEAEAPGVADRIREGDPTLGWLGDDRLELRLNIEHARTHFTKLPRWEVWRVHEQGEPSMVISCIAQRIDGNQLIRQLALHDSRTHDIAKEIFDERDKAKARAEQDFRDENEEKADKFAWALGRDLSSPAQDGRMFPLSSG